MIRKLYERAFGKEGKVKYHTAWDNSRILHSAEIESAKKYAVKCAAHSIKSLIECLEDNENANYTTEKYEISKTYYGSYNDRLVGIFHDEYKRILREKGIKVKVLQRSGEKKEYYPNRMTRMPSNFKGSLWPVYDSIFKITIPKDKYHLIGLEPHSSDLKANTKQKETYKR